MSEIVVFEKENLGQVRVKGDFENPLFCLSDVCKILGLKNPQHAKNAIDSEFDKGGTFNVYPLDTAGGKQDFIFINESELYFLVMRSNKENAKAFRLWVVNDVLPSIRKKGSYTQQEFLTHEQTIDLLIDSLEKQKSLMIENKQLKSENNDKQYRLDVYSDSFESKRNTKKLRTHFNNLVRKLVKQRGGGYSEAFNFVYSEFAKLHCLYDTEINIDYISKNLNYLQECIEIALHAINLYENNKQKFLM